MVQSSAIINEDNDLKEFEDQVLNEEQDENIAEPTTTTTIQASPVENPLKQGKLSRFLGALKSNWKNELLEVFRLCWPILISSVCSSLLGTTDMAFVGRIGSDHLAAAALGNSVFNCVSFIAVGIIGAQDTLISQATGVGNDRMKRVVLQRSVFIVTLTTIPLFIFFMFSEPVLLLIGQEARIAKLTGQFIRLNALGLWQYCMMRLLTRYLTAQRYVFFPMINSICSVLINAAMNYIMIFGVGFKGLGFTGAPLATSITRSISTIILISYTIYIERKKKIDFGNNTDNEESEAGKPSIIRKLTTLVKTTCEPRGIFEYFKLGIPASAAICLEVWGFYLTTFLTGWLGNPAYIGAHSIIQNVTIITFMLPLAISIASSIRIGIALGAEEPDNAKVVSFLGLISSIVIMIGNAIIMMLARSLIAKLFTEDEVLIDLVSSLIGIASLFQIFDGVQVALGGVLRGTGKQGSGAIANFVAFYVVGLPVGWLLCFYAKWKLQGIWIGLLSGVCTVSILLVIYVTFVVNFEDEVRKARERVKRSDVEVLTPTSDEDPIEMEDEIEEDATQDLALDANRSDPEESRVNRL